MSESNLPSKGSIIVTGATGGIGSAVSMRLATDGFRIIAVDLDADRLDDLLVDLHPGEHLAWPADLTDLSGHDRLVDAAIHAGHQLHGLVNLAAVLLRRATLDDITEQDWDRQHDVNLKAAFFLNRATARALVTQGSGGSILNFTSQAWWTGGFGGAAVYAASKGGIVSMSRSLARTLASDEIRVNTIAPGFVATEMMCGGLSQGEVQQFNDMVPLGRMASPEEVAGTVAFLMSNDASYITGATINVSGGQLMY